MNRSAVLSRFTKLMGLPQPEPIPTKLLPITPAQMHAELTGIKHAIAGLKPGAGAAANRIVDPTAPRTPVATPSRAAAPNPNGSSRADRVTKSTSTGQAARRVSAGGSKVDRPGSRFAHLARAFDPEPEPDPETEMPTLSAPYATLARAAETRRAILANQGRIPGAETPEQAADFIARAAAKARGQAYTPPAKPAAAKPDMSTPEGVASFVAASAAKARGNTRR